MSVSARPFPERLLLAPALLFCALRCSGLLLSNTGMDICKRGGPEKSNRRVQYSKKELSGYIKVQDHLWGAEENEIEIHRLL